MGIEYVELFSCIAAWSHELVGGNINAFVNDLYES